LKLKLKLKDLRVIVSMMALCGGSDVIEYDRRRSGLPTALVVMEYYNSIIEI